MAVTVAVASVDAFYGREERENFEKAVTDGL